MNRVIPGALAEYNRRIDSGGWRRSRSERHSVGRDQYVNFVRRLAKQGGTVLLEKVELASPAPQLPNLELRELKNAIARLTEEHRTTVLMVCLEGMTYEEVAQICNIPIGTVRSRLSRAREQLRQMTEGVRPLSCLALLLLPSSKF